MKTLLFSQKSCSFATIKNDIGYGLDEIVVKPKQYIYVETFYRAYVYRGDSLVFFRCGIMPNAYDPKNKKSEHGSLFQASADVCQPCEGADKGVEETRGERIRVQVHADSQQQRGRIPSLRCKLKGRLRSVWVSAILAFRSVRRSIPAR